MDNSQKQATQGADEHSLPLPPKLGAPPSYAQLSMQSVSDDIYNEAEELEKNGQSGVSSHALSYALDILDIDREHQMIEPDSTTTQGSRDTKLKMIGMLYNATKTLKPWEMVSLLYYMHLLMRTVRTVVLKEGMGDGYWKKGVEEVAMNWKYYEQYDEKDQEAERLKYLERSSGN
jgi:hypothetical protein